MKVYDIYHNSNTANQYEAVKNGFSWPGFFFMGIWAFVKGLLPQGIILIAIMVTLEFTIAESEETAIVAFLIGIGIRIFVGYKGNEWRCKKLEEKGFKYLKRIIAASHKDALEKIFGNSTEYEENEASSTSYENSEYRKDVDSKNIADNSFTDRGINNQSLVVDVMIGICTHEPDIFIEPPSNVRERASIVLKENMKNTSLSPDAKVGFFIAQGHLSFSESKAEASKDLPEQLKNFMIENNVPLDNYNLQFFSEKPSSDIKILWAVATRKKSNSTLEKNLKKESYEIFTE